MSTWTAILIAIALWFAITTYLNVQLGKVHAKLDRLGDQFYGLREYLYEIDPQFDDERELLTELFSGDEDTPSGILDSAFAGMEHSELTKKKKDGGFRSLHSLFLDGGFRAPRR